MNPIATVSTAIGIIAVLAYIRSRLWGRVRSNNLVRLYAWLFGVEAGIWLMGTLLFLAAPSVIVKALGSASQFETLIGVMLAGCFVMLVTVSIRAAR